MKSIEPLLKDAGFFQYGIVETNKIHFSQEVRDMCKANVCRQYGKTWACPPAIGTVNECKDRIQRYKNMLVFSGKYELEDSFDYEGMMEGLHLFKESCRKLDSFLEETGELKDYLVLSNEGCDRCKQCTYPDLPCRFPDKVHGALEGYGIFVNELAKQAGIQYINGKNTVTYFGALVY